MAKKKQAVTKEEQEAIQSKKDNELFDKLPKEEQDRIIGVVKQARKYRPLQYAEINNGTISRDPDFPGGKLGWFSALVDATGTLDAVYAGQQLINQAAAVERECDARSRNAVASLMTGIAPKDEIEGMLAAQMVATHNMAMELLRQISKAQYVDNGNQFTNSATKLLRTFTAQVEALKRYRSKGEQKVVVEHVHVHQGGQAIVGAVTQTMGGGAKDGNDGSTSSTGLIEQHNGTTLELPKLEAVRCENEITGNAMPTTRDA